MSFCDDSFLITIELLEIKTPKNTRSGYIDTKTVAHRKKKPVFVSSLVSMVDIAMPGKGKPWATNVRVGCRAGESPIHPAQ